MVQGAADYERTVFERNQDHGFQLRAHELGDVQRPAPADQPEPGAVLVAGNDLWGRRPDDLRVAGPAGPDPGRFRRRRQPGRARRRIRAYADQRGADTAYP